ncbi:sulfide:quinone oxidoreductase [Clonorchis sinensis]|uniref:Sulfide:quinone oxidoreductase n=2 Tax=Clonorchis sinensis TaxID=79923 RepID=A0A8T1MPJ5_CLOSI|nr:sulfide:quinone oxidoreductase [Clonorchis sinensis]GAA27369.2 sulfide:quinone oxidoreductase mitochondrial [Clonorchis sinensis]
MNMVGRTLLPKAVFLQLSNRTLCSSGVAHQHHKIVIVGGGSAGASLASRLTKFLSGHNIAVIEPSDVHYYQPLWTLVGAGLRPFKDSVIPMSKAIPESVHWIRDAVFAIDPEKSKLHLKSGKQVTYDQLILALGMELRFDLIPGAVTALNTDPRVCSNYSAAYVEKTFNAYQSFKGGRAIFTLPVGPIKCAGAPQKVMYLFEDYLRKKGQRQSAEILYFTALPAMFSVAKYSDSLAAICRERGIHFYLQHHLTEVNSAKSEITVENLQTKELKTLQYDLLHITPPMAVSQVLKDTPKLTKPSAANYVDVDPATLRHTHYPNVWAIGDCSSLPTSKTTAAVASQLPVLCKNLKSVLTGGTGNVEQYDGYTACPLVTGYNRGILAEFDYTMKPLETLPTDQSKERYVHYWLKTAVMPPLYLHWMLKGLWSGPKYVRKILHLGFSK